MNKRILQVEFSQVDKIFTEDILNNLTTPQAIGKNTEKQWILDTSRQIRNELINRFLFAAQVSNYFAVAIKKPLIKGA